MAEQTEHQVQTDVGKQAHDAAVRHLEACFEDPAYDGVMAGFCGCLDCIVREVLFAAYPILVGEGSEGL